MRLTLRGYQVEALERITAAEQRGVRRQLGVAACGMGKTVIFCALAERRGQRTLILAHRDELVAQAAAKVREVWPEATVGVVKAERDEVRADVVVASVQTLARPARLARLIAPFTEHSILLKPAEPFGLVVVDEAHHTAADSYRGILTALRAGESGCDCGQPHERVATPDEVSDGCELGVAYDPCPGPAGPLLLGVTATPDRGDGKGLDDLFDEITFSYDLLWGIRAGYLCDMRGRRVTIETLDLSAVKVRQGDYDAGAAGRAMEAAGAEHAIVRAWQAEASDRRTLVFTPTVETARLTAEAFQHVGVDAEYVHGGTPMEDRRDLLRRYTAGDVHVLVNCSVLTEGTDLPRTDCVVMARPTRSRALYAQCVGRGARLHPDKTDCLVLDMVGASAEHSLVTIPSLFGLDEAFAARMGDGSGLLAQVVQERDDQLVKLGKLRAEDADLFRRLRAEGEGIAWLPIHTEGDPLRRYIRPLGRDQAGAERPTVVLAQRGEDVWTAGLWWPATKDEPERKAVLLAEVSMEMAQGVAEDYVRRNGVAVLSDANAAWRRKKPSGRAVTAAKRWRMKDPERFKTAGELSDALDAHIARVKAKPRRKVTA